MLFSPLLWQFDFHLRDDVKFNQDSCFETRARKGESSLPHHLSGDPTSGACQTDIGMQQPQLHIHPNLTPNTFGQSSDLLGFNYKSNSQPWMDDGAVVGFIHRRQYNSRVKCNGTDATTFITVNFIQNLIWLCNEMYVVNIWFCSFFILLHSSFKGVPERGSELFCNLVDKLLISIWREQFCIV